ncbi:hypothetical protein [Spirilliplanes yamanashiensis]|uniref:Uncharacterized protein n=1 Tax=Spirilliplanes yamanashiensis TaxID=42233 RepID=A0A8J3YDB6_9ACTN|nr:hypothetical protein [Spirilliplanes yamanashiensis]MDP9818273.1 regulator of protease activity HflC (stomatin/prohibitin superfamily) [Spirilliplanes yamanashiensis]GIJ06691.1 hypothetical protein Sya03_60430 [Spirilliplanes yamanashiensis]
MTARPAPAAVRAALGPVRAALVRRARAEAARLRAAAAAEAAERLAAARARAAEITAEAERGGQADAETLGAATVAAAGRDARRLALAAQRRAWDGLRAAVRRQLTVPGSREALAARVVAALGPAATLTEIPGGVAGEVPGRRVELTLDALADEAVGRLGPAVAELWRP